MKFAESWLRAYCDPKIGTQELADGLTMAGFEVESMKPVAPRFEQIVVAKVLSVERHPQADKLTVCQVQVSQSDVVHSIVCGAPNVAAGIVVPCALPGAVMPSGMQIKVSKLRGVESQGMLCSSSELGLSEDHSGLMILPADAPIGANIRDYLALDDTVFELKLTPNRPDCLGVYGIARELSAITGAPLQALNFPAALVSLDERLPVRISAPDLCGRFSGRIIRGVNAKAVTPDWMKSRLERAGQRSISALVDISNYVMLELSRPTHVFDLDKIHGGLDVRWGRTGESLKLLNGDTIALDEKVGVIADQQAVESLAGIMGGDATAVSLATQNVYVEAAFWWPTSIAGRARRFNFTTDAGHRFERGVDASTTVEHIEYLSRLILQVCGGQAGPVDDQITGLPARPALSMRVARACKVIGVEISTAEMLDCFKRLGLTHRLQAADDVIVVEPPPYRFDLQIEEDLIEEVARIWGFERLPLRPTKAAITMMPASETSRSVSRIKHLVAGRDYQEVLNFSFAERTVDHTISGETAIAVINPIASHLDVMRTSLITSLIGTLKTNLNHKASRVRLFEIGRVYRKDLSVAEGPLTVQGVAQPWRLGLLAYGPARAAQWGVAERDVDYFDLKGDIESLLPADQVRFERTDHPALHPGRSAKLLIGERSIGVIGELHPALQVQFDFPRPAIVAEIDMAALVAAQVPAFSGLSKFPGSERDLAFIVTETVSAQQLLDQIHAAIAATPVAKVVMNVKLFDEYRGKGLENKEKSLAFRFWMQDTERTLSDAEVAQTLAAIRAWVAERLGARLRT